MSNSAVILRNEAHDAHQMLRAGSSEVSGRVRLIDEEEWKRLNGIEAPYRQSLQDDLPREWTVDHFAKTVVWAFRIIERQQGPKRPKPPGNHWQETIAEWADRLAWCELPPHEQRERDEEKIRKWSRATLTSSEIYRAETVRDWVRDLRMARPTQGIVLAAWATVKVFNGNVTDICRGEGWKSTSFYRWRDKGIEWIIERLNDKRIEVF